MHKLLRTLTTIGFFITAMSVYAQTTLPNLYLDCRCDRRFITQEITYMNHVRDQSLADIQLLINDISTGSGGRRYDLTFTGQNAFENITNEVTYNVNANQTSAEAREGLVKAINQGLLPFILESNLAENINFFLEGLDNKPQDTVEYDPWKQWIFEIRGEGDFAKESSRNSVDFEFGLEGDRVTENWRIRQVFEINHTKEEFIKDDETFSSITKFYYGRTSVVKSLSTHWSAGIFAGLHHDSYSNINFAYFLRPAVEYNIFPYHEVLKREITFSYRIGYTYNDYLEPTIFEKEEENLFNHSLNMEVRFRQIWGDLYSSIRASSFLHDFSKNRLQLYNWVSVRVFKGLAVRFSANIQIIRDQLNLPVGDASLEDVLLRQRQIATDFTASTRVGLSYTFGSAYNNIVNTRL